MPHRHQKYDVIGPGNLPQFHQFVSVSPKYTEETNDPNKCSFQGKVASKSSGRSEQIAIQ